MSEKFLVKSYVCQSTRLDAIYNSSIVSDQIFKSLLNTAAEIFQKAFEEVLIGLQGCINISNDIIILGRDQQEHNQHLEDADGIAIQDSKIGALVNAANPKNASGVRSILGLANRTNWLRAMNYYK